MITYKTKPDDEKDIFSILHPHITAWFKQKFGKFTEPQKYGILEIHNKNNILVTAPTGTGKTLTAMSSILNELFYLDEHNQLENKVYCIYISPLKSLTRDLEINLKEPLKEIEEIAKRKIGIRIGVRTGDTTASEKAKQLRSTPHILFLTPETLAIVLNSPKLGKKLADVKWLVVDEIHALANNKRGVHLSLTLERLQAINPGICRIGLGATIEPLNEMAKFLVGMKNEKEPRDCKIADARFLKSLDLQVISPLPDLINNSPEQVQKALYEKLHDLIQKHKTTIVFTNTRSATERVVNHLKEKFAKHYIGKIAAHHSSVGRNVRLKIEDRLKKGELKICVSSTSLELGIDIGYVDLVVLLGSPKSIARALQRIGRSGHHLHDTVKGRIIVLDRDDLIECSVLLKNAKESRIDRIDVPQNALDVLAQQIYGAAIAGPINEKELFSLIRKSYCYRNLTHKDFEDILNYLAGGYTELENRHVYAKIWRDKETGMIGKRGKMARVIYMTNIGTIPDEARVEVKIGNEIIGHIDEAFLERLRKGDVFVLGGEKFEFLYSRGMTVQVKAAEQRPPTVPSWVSEMLPLSFDLANEIQHFRMLMDEKFRAKKGMEEIMKFINEYLYCDKNAAEAIYGYFEEQFKFAKIPHEKKLVIEQVKDDDGNHLVFHSLYGRRVNDALSISAGFIISKLMHKDVAVSINDNGFIISSDGKIPLENALNILKKENLREIARMAVEKSEVLKRRFRHCATRSLMILRTYRGRTKSVGRQHMSSHLLFSAVKGIDPDFCILREARREVLEDLMDIKSAEKVIARIKDGTIKVEHIVLDSPSPFAFNVFAMGRADTIKMENRIDFIRRMHFRVMEKISKKWPERAW